MVDTNDLSLDIQNMLNPTNVETDYDIFDSEPTTWSQVDEAAFSLRSEMNSAENYAVFIGAMLSLESDSPETEGKSGFEVWWPKAWAFIKRLMKNIWEAISKFAKKIWNWFTVRKGPDGQMSGKEAQDILNKTNPDEPFTKSREDLQSVVQTVGPDENTILKCLKSPEKGRFEMHPWHILDTRFQDVDRVSAAILSRIDQIFSIVSEEEEIINNRKIHEVQEEYLKERLAVSETVNSIGSIWDKDTKAANKYEVEELKKIYDFLKSREQSKKIEELKIRSEKLSKILRIVESRVDQKMKDRKESAELKSLINLFRDTISLYSSSEKLYMKIVHGYAQNLLSTASVIPKAERIVILKAS